MEVREVVYSMLGRSSDGEEANSLATCSNWTGSVLKKYTMVKEGTQVTLLTIKQILPDGYARLFSHTGCMMRATRSEQ